MLAEHYWTQRSKRFHFFFCLCTRSHHQEMAASESVQCCKATARVAALFLPHYSRTFHVLSRKRILFLVVRAATTRVTENAPVSESCSCSRNRVSSLTVFSVGFTTTKKFVSKGSNVNGLKCLEFWLNNTWNFVYPSYDPAKKVKEVKKLNTVRKYLKVWNHCKW